MQPRFCPTKVKANRFNWFVLVLIPRGRLAGNSQLLTAHWGQSLSRRGGFKSRNLNHVSLFYFKACHEFVETHVNNVSTKIVQLRRVKATCME